MRNKIYYLADFFENTEKRPQCPENKRLLKNKKSACHPERSRSFSERTVRKNRGAIATKGSHNEFGWLLNRCYIPLESHQDSLRDPANRKRFALLPRSSLGKSSTPLRMTGWLIILLLLIEKQATFIACSFLCIIFRCKKILFNKSLGAVAEQEGRLPCFEFCHKEFFSLDFGKCDLVAQKGVAP